MSESPTEQGLNVNGAAENSFINSLPEDIRSEASLANIKDVHGLAKGYVNAQKLVGSSIRIPSAEAAPEVRADFYKRLSGVPDVLKLPNPESKEEVEEFYTKLGRPKTPEEYKIQIKEGVNLDPVGLSSFTKHAHALGLTNTQTQELINFEANRHNEALQQMENQKQSAKSLLQNTWGTDYEARLNAAQDVAKHFGQKYPDAVKQLFEGPGGNNPVVLMMAAELGKSYRESGIIKGQTTLQFGKTPEEARAQIQEIRNNPKHDYYVGAPNARQAAIDKVESLYKSAYPEASND